ncbi:outer membrane receptor protein involved in Fe transport [Sphingobium sp. B11D3B]|uniref:TonB-dependent receptor plug domain-containing protein n=1 Tax=Sphingobium sp. B11D3B TaxID=2940575 RepID=UPI002226F481|nr:TonB-dependent receptor [Sphingobium sp. B11D3B]MCW2389112.1 outer membrane receptor protein involved in Fe transport [Sphingobium sp. B11D3B]
MKKTTSQTLLKLAAAPAVLGLAMLSSAAHAQEPQNADGAEDGEVIIVTGSRIAQANVGSVAPVQVLTSEAIQSSGAVNIQEALLENPVFGTPSSSRTNSAFSSSTAGVSTIDLRNLGTNRTLVLVNGRRMVSGIAGSAAVDLNAIPTAMLDRVEVLTSGSASAVYGSDAVAGVVNFITKQDFQGLELTGQSGITQRGDSFTLDTGLMFGSNFADGRGNIVVYGGYSEQGVAYKRNHATEWGPSDVDNLSAIFSDPEGKFYEAVTPYLSGYSPQGRYFTDNYAWTYDRGGAGALRPCASTNGGIAPADCGAFAGQQIGPDGFNRTNYRYLAVPTQRYMFASNAHYDVSDDITAFFEGSFISTKVRAVIEPFPWDTDTSGKQYANGQMPIETLYNGAIVRNPFVPDAIYNDSSDTDGDGLRDIFVSKRLFDFGDRVTDATRQTFRIVAGLRGQLGDNWNWEAFGNYGQTDINQTGTGQINVINFRYSQQIVPNGSGGFMCADPNARANGCIPANVFGLGSLAPAVGYLEAPSNFSASIKQTQVGANLSGSLFSLTGKDDVGVTVGAEYRRESAASAWDALQSAGLNGSNALPPTSGSFDLYEFYGEALVPLIQESFIYDFSVRGAARYSHYSTVGDTFSWNVGAEFAPIRDIRFRAMLAQTVRAPNVTELFEGLSQDFPQVNDPCEGIGATGGGTVGDVCRASPGVLTNIAQNGTFLVNQSDRQGVTSFAGGNPDLQEEKGRTLTAGVVINPVSIDALRRLTLSVDYFRVRIQDAIVDTPLQFILQQCYEQNIQSFCDFVVRRPAALGQNTAGSLDEVNSGRSNSGGYYTSGIDVNLNYVQGISLGASRFDLGLNVAYTHVIDGYVIPLPGAAMDPFVGEIGASRDRFTVNTSFGNKDVKLSLVGTYIGEAYLDDQFTGVEAGTADAAPYRLHPEFYLDTQLRFFFNERSEFYVGVDNVFDNNPIFTGGLPDTMAAAGQDADTGTYQALGRSFYAGVKLRF